MENKLYVLGVGPGSENQVTPEVRAAIESSRAVACAPRHLHLVSGHPNVIEMKNFQNVFERLREELLLGDVSAVVSGDPGIFSLLPLIKKNFPNQKITVLPGISSLQSLCARAGETWQDSVILSGHGREISDEKILGAVENNRSVIFFCGGSKEPSWLCSLLSRSGLGSAEAVIGERLGEKDERVRRGEASSFVHEKFDPLSIALIINEKFTEPKPPLPDDASFIRKQGVPMTGEEVRAVIISKLRLTPDSVMWDIGAGTGSVTVAAAQLCREVHAVEVSETAAELVRENVQKFRLRNVSVREGSALSVIDSLPKPDVVFIGGSGAELPEIVEKISQRGEIRLVISAVSLKTAAFCQTALTKFDCFDAVQLSVSKVKTVGGTLIWQAKNPVIIFSAVTKRNKGGKAE